MRYFFWISFCLLVFVPNAAYARVLEPTQVVDGNFVARERVIDLKGVIRHDAFVIGKNVNLSGTIGGDAFVVADTLNISGTIDGSLRAFARNIAIDGVVGKSVTVAARSLTLSKSARVGWDVWAKVSTAKISATIDGNLELRARHIVLDGIVRKNVEARVPRRGDFTIRQGANVVGDVLYLSPTEGLDVDAKAQVQGRINHDPRALPIRVQAVGFVALILGLAVVGAALMLLAPSLLTQTSGLVDAEFVYALLTGVLTVFVTTLVIPFVMLSGVGFALGLILLLTLLVGLYLGTLVSVYTLGVFALHYGNRKLPQFQTLIVGLIIYAVTLFVPLIGVFVKVVAAVSGLGAIVLTVKQWNEVRGTAKSNQ